jgi:hypothetical protein
LIEEVNRMKRGTATTLRNKAITDQLLEAKEEVEKAVDEKLAEAKKEIMDTIDRSLGERILSGREAS